ncbi:MULTISPECIES: EF-P lysine aminoacylase GenX [unclassified Treponema]|uniref:EF-P lysine aminoacylase GenX n=1 Tax=unclassified Treponema TaxID=2638727 RepID=UPI0020A32723|nr:MULTISPECIES: amino acid--tRNA ligase-related protein [unclassified Treponema]UTC66059.1 elongation factor P--(R)-beta-lysine ligase [Treponema sp. OMZ 789]UTC68789.1 elongation factor P--(R)-beta-lysine ligase [Treponema sp. OMZ 790]UTC71518.1 elongation factor P--(R)-beta-lysine ligase [Treponema sp. OMZ 791]
MDIEALELRALSIQAAREFFIKENYLELDTPALSAELIPETCLEVLKTEYLSPGASEGLHQKKPLFLVPSPEVYIKPIIAQTSRSVFQISKCYRNAESIGNIHSPEFTMLEYYTMDANYKDSIKITEAFLNYVSERVKENPLVDGEVLKTLSNGFECLTMDEAFRKYAGLPLSTEHSPEELAAYAEKLGLGEAKNYSDWKEDDLYELILVHAVEPNLPKNKLIALLDYPAFVPCLAAENSQKILNKKNEELEWKTVERWEVYLNGVELANCYTEERDKKKIDSYFEKENGLKQKHSLIPHPPVKDFGSVCSNMPPCSGVAMGFDRLIMLLAGKKTLFPIIHRNCF